MSWVVKLKSWRAERGFNKRTYVLKTEVSNLLEECTEYLRAETEHDSIDALCDIVVFSVNALSYLGKDKVTIYPHYPIYPYNIYNILIDIGKLESSDRIACYESIINYSKTIIDSMGYDFTKCMEETVAEISSRKQDPEQALKWKIQGGNITGEKWQKNRNQYPSTLYKANYIIAKQ